ncbi:MAG: helix-turn-helix domain-containing protein [Bacillota bacterium]|nr:helix-turn-helix domain-containing protein [Bacillota bacterium]
MDALMTRAELASALHVSVRTVARLTAAGRIPVINVGRRRLYRLEDVLTALSSDDPPGRRPARRGRPRKPLPA